MVPWELIIGLLVGGCLMFMLITSDDKKQEKKEQWLLDELDSTLDVYNSITVVYD
jgi:preprotein translocase subunit YajC